MHVTAIPLAFVLFRLPLSGLPLLQSKDWLQTAGGVLGLSNVEKNSPILHSNNTCSSRALVASSLMKSHVHFLPFLPGQWATGTIDQFWNCSVLSFKSVPPIQMILPTGRCCEASWKRRLSHGWDSHKETPEHCLPSLPHDDKQDNHLLIREWTLHRIHISCWLDLEFLSLQSSKEQMSVVCRHVICDALFWLPKWVRSCSKWMVF